MTKLFLRQILFVISTFLGVTIITFSLLMLAPEDIETNNLTTANVVNNEQQVEKNIIQLYFQYLGNTLKGDLGATGISRVGCSGYHYCIYYRDTTWSFCCNSSSSIHRQVDQLYINGCLFHTSILVGIIIDHVLFIKPWYNTSSRETELFI